MVLWTKVHNKLGEISEYVLQALKTIMYSRIAGLQQSEAILGNEEGNNLVVCGDTPLLRPETMPTLFETFIKQRMLKQTIFNSNCGENPTGYGRILRGIWAINGTGGGKIVFEQKDGFSRAAIS